MLNKQSLSFLVIKDSVTMGRHQKMNFCVLQNLINRTIDGSNINSSMFTKICGQSHTLYRKDLYMHYGCVNAVEFSNDGTLFISGGDDRRVLLWRVSEVLNDELRNSPTVMDAEHSSNVFCLSFNHDNSKIFSGGNDEQVIIHDTKSRKPLNYFRHERVVHSIALNYECNSLFATACDDGKIRVFDTRQPCTAELPSVVLAKKDAPFHSVMFNPVDNRIVATANAKHGTELWDIREPNKCLMRYPNKSIAMSARFNNSGTRLLCLRRKYNPIIYELHHQGSSGIELSEDGYSNSCTMKSCTFAGSGDEFAVSGSDDHNIYLWKLPTDNLDTQVHAHMVLRGHLSIVNNVRYNPSTCCLVSSGVEKNIRFWSSSPFPNSVGGLDQAAANDMLTRTRISKDSIRRGSDNGEFMRPDDAQRSTEEDRGMLAFFDLLVERSSASWSLVDSDSDSDSISDSIRNEDNANLPYMFDTSESEGSSFSIESSFSDSSQQSNGAEAGPSGWNPGVTSQTDQERTRATGTVSLGAYVMSLLETTSGEEEEEEVPHPPSSKRVRPTEPVAFRQVGRQRKQFRRRLSSSSSSS